MYISHLQFEYWLKQFYLSEDLLRSPRLTCLSQSYLRSSPTTPILRNTGPYLLWAQHQSWSQSPSEHPTTSDAPVHPTTPKSRSSTNLTVYLNFHSIDTMTRSTLTSLRASGQPSRQPSRQPSEPLISAGLSPVPEPSPSRHQQKRPGLVWASILA